MVAWPVYPPFNLTTIPLLPTLLTMTRPSKRNLVLRAFNNSRKKRKIEKSYLKSQADHGSQPNQESQPDQGSQPDQESQSDQESEIEELPINIPDLPELENDDLNDQDAFTVLRNSTKDVNWRDTHLSYARQHQPSRQTLWRHQQRQNELQAAAAGSYDIRSMFNKYTQPSVVVPSAIPPTVPLIVPPIETTPSRDVVLTKAITDLENALGYNRASRKFEMSLNHQTKQRHRAVLHFLYLQRKHPTATRKDLSLQVAHSFNRGKYFSESVVTWERMWIHGEGIPEGRSGCHTKLSSLYNDEAVQLFAREFISSKKEEITASLLARAVTEYVGSQEMGARLQASLELVGTETDPGTQSLKGLKARAATNWLKKMGYSWRSTKKGVYVDGHEREDVVKYRQDVFLPILQGVRSMLAKWDDNGNVVREENLPEGGRWVVIVTHDESTFNVNDGRRQMWLQDEENPLRPKGNGKGIMVSEFLTPRGRLKIPESVSDDQLEALRLRRFATEIFEYGAEKYWNSEMLAEQTLEVAVPLFEVAFPPDQFQGLFLFDNATSHNVMAPNALDTRKMNLGPGGKQPVMRDGWNPSTNTPQPMNDSNGQPKGIRIVLQERGLWPTGGIRLQCTKKTRKLDGSCCARHLLSMQPDFSSQKGYLQEEIEKRGHLVAYYPKYHPELNFIEYFWGYCKRFARENCEYTLAGLRTTVPRALATVPMETIRRFFEKTMRIGDAYREGHRYGTREFSDKAYKSHRRV